jgi:hypothetical protein
MTMWIKMTLVIFFINAILVACFPEYLLGGSQFFQKDNNGNYGVNSELSDSITKTIAPEEGLPKSSFGITDGWSLLLDFFTFLANMLFGSFFIILYFEGIWQLLVGFPITLCYILAIFGWWFKC